MTSNAAAAASMARPLTVQKQSSRTAPAQMQSVTTNAGIASQIQSVTPKEIRGLSRRHSFNNNNNASPRPLYRQTSSSSTASNPRYYEADVESDSLNTKDGSWSDSESGFLHPPIKAKLKGLLGIVVQSNIEMGEPRIWGKTNLGEFLSDFGKAGRDSIFSIYEAKLYKTGENFKMDNINRGKYPSRENICWTKIRL